MQAHVGATGSIGALRGLGGEVDTNTAFDHGTLPLRPLGQVGKRRKIGGPRVATLRVLTSATA